MRAALQIAAKDLKLRLRDRSVFIIGIVAPFALALIFSQVFGPAADPTSLNLQLGLVDEDRSEVASAFREVLAGAEGEGLLELTEYADRESAEAAVSDGEVGAFFHIPAGFGQAVATGSSTNIDVVGDVDASTTTSVATSFAERFATAIGTGQLALLTAADVSGQAVTPAFLASLGTDPSAAAMTFEIVDGSADSKQLDATTYLVAGMAVFFLFFTVQFGVSGLLEEEREGTLPRLMTAPIPRVSVIAGKALLSFFLGVVSMAILMIAASFLMGADWGSPLGAAVLVLAGVASATGIMGLVSAVARTPEGAGNLGSIIAVVLGMLGGTFFPIGSTGGVLANLTLLTPHAWFLRGLAELTADAPWTAALPAAGAIIVFALVTGGLAWILLRRRWAR